MGKRIYYLDFLRSYAIIMVILVHSISEYIVIPALYGSISWYVNLFLNAFARTGVPIFLMISGALLLSSDSTKNIGVFYKRSIKRIVLPLVVWNVIYFFFQAATGTREFKLWELFYAIINQGTEYHLWYLYTLLGIYLLAPFLKILVDNCSSKRQYLLLLIMLLATTIIPFINSITQLYINLFDPLFNGYLSCFLMGYIISNISSKPKNTVMFVLIGVFGLLCSVIYHNINSSKEAINLFFNYGYSICHYSLAASVFYLVKTIFGKKVIFTKTVTFLSKYSFGAYLTHVMVTNIIFKNFLFDSSPIILECYIFATTIIFSFLITFLLGRIKYIKNIVK